MNKIYSLKYSVATGGLIAVPELARKVSQKSCGKLSLTGLTTLALTLSSSALAATVRADIPYQTFRDFAENKGSFFVGNTNIAIKNNAGNIIGYLDKAPMPDFSSASVAATLLVPGEHTLYSPQYVVTARHVNGTSFGTTNISFGYKQNEYSVIEEHNHPSSMADIKTLRLNKLVTEVAPAIVSTSGAVNNAYNKNSIYTAFYRLGGGDKNIKNINGTTTHVDGDFLIGGTIGYLSSYNNNLMISSGTAQIFNENYQGYLANYLQPGDSGSPLFGYNSKTKEWELIGVTSSMSVNGNNWAVTSRDFLSQKPKNDFEPVVRHTDTSAPLVWKYSSNTGEIKNNQDYYQIHSGKNLYFTGKNGHVDIQSSVNQGAGYLQFTDSYTVSTTNGSSWIGGGIIVEDGATVNWGVNGVEGDNLHKVGSGTLVINGIGENKGGLKVGDGLVILAQKKDNDNNIQAASSLDISSGRATVKLTDSNQINPNNITWGYRGGRLDINGSNIEFSRLNASDYGAIIENGSSYKSTLTLNLKAINPDDIIVKMNQMDFRGGNGTPGELYLDKDTGRYYILKKNTYSPTFFGINSNEWTFAGNNKTQAIAFYKNIKVASSSTPYMYHGQLNGYMDVHVPSLSGSNILALDGSVDISGDFEKETGTLIFQGHPVLHAGKRPSPSQNDWKVRQFNLNVLKLDGAEFHLSRNSTMKGDIHANNSVVILGSNKVYTDNNDGTGNTIESVAGESTPDNDKDISTLSGYIYSDNSVITVNNKFNGGIFADNKSIINVHGKNSIINAGSEISKDSKLSLQNGSKLTTEVNFINLGILEIGENATLNLQGYKVWGGYIPSIHDIGNVTLTGEGATLSAGNYTMFNGIINANDTTSVKLTLGDNESKLSELNPNPELTTKMFGDCYNTSWTGSIHALKGDVDMVNSIWRMSNNSTLNHLNTKNSLFVFSSDNGSLSTLTVNEIKSDDSTFVMRSTSTASDKLVVNNKLEGTNNNLIVDYIANDGKEKTLNHVLISSPKNTAKEVFNAQTQTVGFSDVKPIIENLDTEENTLWILKGFNTVANQGTTQKAVHFMSSGYKAFLAEVNNLNKRMGDLRDINGEAGAWARIMSGTGSAGGGFSDNYTHVQVGADKKHELDGLDLFTGVTMTYTDSHAGSDAFSGETKSVGAGIYASAMFESGAYIDLIGKFVHHDNEYTATFAGLGTRDYSSHSWYAGAEVGYRYHVTDDTWIEPQAELVYGAVSGKQFSWKDQGMNLTMKDKDFNPLIGRTGVDVGKSFSGKDWKVTARAGLGYQFDLFANGETVLRDASGEKRIKGEKDGRMLMNVGLNAEIRDNARFGLEFEKSAFGKYNVDNAINANFRYSF
ncbi:S6 family peptidase [Escherichia coli]|uniref:S6 family peptidase n=1 Tax=Escherichia coli TaxID=562 RepID=UPI000BB89170|nr:S6 family peptidase [Escherichia coli]